MNRLTKILLAASLVPASAYAQGSIAEFDIHSGDQAGLLWQNGPRNNDQRGAGAEHQAAALIPNAEGGAKLVVSATASYTDIPDSPVNHRIQALCASYKLDPMQGLVKDQIKYVTNNNGDEYQNAHKISLTPVLGGTAVLQTYGYDPNNNTQFYGQVLDGSCNKLANQTLLLAKNNDDVNGTGDAEAAITYDSPTETRLVECVIGNGNGRDDGWCLGISVKKDAAGKVTVKRDWDISVVAQEERTRMYVVPTAIPEHVLYCAAEGNSQPPQIGVRCGLINAAPGVNNNERIVYRKFIAQREGQIYRTTPNVAVVRDAEGKPTNDVVISYVEVDLRGRNGRNKGKTTIMTTRAKIGPTSLEFTTPSPDMIPFGDKAHPSMCTGNYGPNGESVAFLLGGSIVDGARTTGTATVIGLEGTNAMKKVRDIAIQPLALGYISQYYGNNPNTPQGRNHQTCAMLRNPGYGVVGGFQPEVKDFLLMPSTSRKLRQDGTAQDKLALSVVLVPAVVPAAAPTPDPEPDPMPNPDPQPEPDPVEPEPNDPGGSVGGCSTSGSSNGAMILVLGAAVAILRRRRRN
jgi:uncharacterized protein (TIGR03382 family)